MEGSRLFAELVEVARKAGIEVRTESFAGVANPRRPRGGLCTIRGKRVIVVDEAAALPDRIGIVASALRSVDLGGVQLAPAVRAAIVVGGVHPPRPRRPLARTRARPGKED